VYVKTSIFVLAASALVAFVAGCGGDDSTAGAGESTAAASSSTPRASTPIAVSPLSKTVFIKRANANCHRLRGDRVRALDNSADAHPRDGETREELRVRTIRLLSIPTLEAQAEQLREFGAPSGDEKQMEEILAAYESAAELGTKLKSMKEKAAVNQGFRKASLMAKEYGLDECVVYDVGY
jgi:hypothetical protein